MQTDTQSRVEFTPPSGFRQPEGSGDEFDLVCTFKAKGEGKVCLVKFGDQVMPGYDETKETKDNKPDYSEMARSLASADTAASSGSGAGASY